MIVKNILQWELYTDGSCKKRYNQGFGGWAFIAFNPDGEEIMRKWSEPISGFSTNQKMELTAAIEGLKFLDKYRKGDEYVTVYSDSAYLVNCCNQGWYRKWMINGWANSKGEDVANIELWWELIPYFDDPHYTFVKVQGHDKNYYNNECDKLAQMAAEEAVKNWKGLAHLNDK